MSTSAAGLTLGGGALAGGGALGGGALSGLGSFLGGSSASKAADRQAAAQRAALQQYLDYIQGQRNTFLNATSPVRQRLESYATGNVGYDKDTLEAMRAGIYEDYGKSLKDVSRISKAAGTGPGNVYAPGRADHAMRVLAQNLAVARSQDDRSVEKQNADLATSNMRFATGALPTYEPGLPATVVPDPSVFQGLNAVSNMPQPNLFGSMATGLGGSLSSISGQMFANKYPTQYIPYQQQQPLGRSAIAGSQFNPINQRFNDYNVTGNSRYMQGGGY